MRQPEEHHDHGRSLDRYDLTGRDLTKWRPNRFGRLIKKIRELLQRGRDAELPATDKTIGDHTREVPGKALDLADAHLRKQTIENQLREAETRRAYAEAEMTKAHAAKLRAETSRTKVQTAREIAALVKELRQLTDGKPPPVVIDQDGREVILLADMKELLGATDARSATDPRTP